ncbi:Asp-tRNA(Asn)/Glu-tRNA(Gln) amidotransferase subunit GatB [Candidatus Dependentiae bacterium]|nr:Asp-tRNA(Asn)/Glu-tRNA(Gln) amidotransferase subunit GatB [Candidatus Dependentiae bacterium]
MSQETSIFSRYPDYETTIGIEVHVQLKTNSKIFCTCSNSITTHPNTNICQICTGQPGVLPVLNKEVVSAAIKAGLATNCTLTPVSCFARKHYFYPDLPKNYQITQSDRPICSEGYVPIRLEDGSVKHIRLIRIHMEEDAGKNIHSNHSNESFVDLNRTGTPLLEIVTYPDISSAYEAREYLKALRLIVQYLDICSGNMEDGAFRADTNISVRKKGAPQLGTKCELKNINSFKFISDAIEYETERQIELIEEGGKVKQETRLWNTKDRKTESMRSKEEAADYRYFDDPDLPLIALDPATIEATRAAMPELPWAKLERLQTQHTLSAYEAEILVNDQQLANYYQTAAQHTQSKQLINWVLRDIMGLLKDQKISLNDCKITPVMLAQLVELISKGAINNRAAQEVFALMARTGEQPDVIVKEKGLEQEDNSQELEVLIKEIVEANPKVVADYKAGNERLLGFFVGQAMQKTKGKGNPQLINELLKKYLS